MVTNVKVGIIGFGTRNNVKGWEHGNSSLKDAIFLYFIINFTYVLVIIIFMPFLQNNSLFFGFANYIRHVLGKWLCNRTLTFVHPTNWCHMMLTCVWDKWSILNKVMWIFLICKLYHSKEFILVILQWIYVIWQHVLNDKVCLFHLSITRLHIARDGPLHLTLPKVYSHILPNLNFSDLTIAHCTMMFME